MSLSQQALVGVLWASLEKFGGRTINFIVAIFLYRLLTPEDFGLVALLAIFLSISLILIDSGFSQALVREDQILEKDKSTVFYINLILALSIFIVIWFSAPFISDFFEEPVLLWLARFLALSPLFSSIAIIQRVHFTHKINFRTQAFINLISASLSGLSAISLALYGFGVWALATQYVLLAFVSSFLFWGVHPWLPKGFVYKDSFKKLFNFGSKLMLSSLINTSFVQGYKVIIGKLYSTTILGYYSQAENLNNIISQNLVGILTRVVYPTLSKVQDDGERLKKAYIQIIKVTSLVVFPAALGLALVAEPMILTLVGKKWINSVPIIQILTFSALIYHLQVFNLDILKVIGRSDLFLKLEIIKKIGVTVAIIIGLYFGFTGLIILQVVSSYFALFINMRYTSKILKYSKLNQFKDVFSVLVLSIPMVIAIFLIDTIKMESNGFRLFILFLTGVVVYLGTVWIVKPTPFKDLIGLLKPRFPVLNKINL
ncbi:MAG: lipopolysaccharide biosynthesis protein [Balneola sp.]